MPGRAVRRDEAFGRRLVEAMARAGVKPATLAATLDVLPGTVSRWRRGECPDDLRFPRIAGVLGVRLEWLKTGAGDPSPQAEPTVAPGDVERLRALLARLAFFKNQLKAYRDLGTRPGAAVIAEWLELLADIEEAKGA